jgi:uncharacterized membrane protein
MAQRLNISIEEVRHSISDLGLDSNSGQSTVTKIDNFFDNNSVFLLFIFAAFYILFFSFVCFIRYNSFNYSDFDLAVYAQVLWNVLHGSMQSSILGIPFLGNHFDLILFLVVPIYAVFKSPLILLIIQSIFLGAGVVPLYLLVKHLLDKKFAFLFCVLYLSYPAIHFVNLYEFHPVAFVTFFLLFMLYYFEKEKFSSFLLFMFLSMSCKENIALGIFFFGLYILIFRKRSIKWSLAVLLSSCLYLIVSVKIMDFFNKGTIEFGYIYSHIGKSLPEVGINLLKHPSDTFRYIVNYGNGKFLFQLLFPLGFLCILSPKVLFISLPFFLQQLLSIRPEDHAIEYHYAAKLIPFLFFGAAYGLKLLLKSRYVSRHRNIFWAMLFILAILSNFMFGVLPKMPQYFSERYFKQDIDYSKQALVDKIPKDASVVTTFEFLPKLSQRKELYSFHHVYIGKYTLSSKKDYVLPDSVEYALMDFDDYLLFTSFHLPGQYANLKKFFDKDKWGLVSAVDNIGLFRKNIDSNISLFQFLDTPRSLGSTRLLIEENVNALGYEIENKKLNPGESIHISFIWECIKETGKDYWIAFKLVDKYDKIIHQFNHPVCYRIAPTFSWAKADIIKEDIWMLVPLKTKVKEARLKMFIFDRSTAGRRGGIAKGVAIRANTYGIFDDSGWIDLGSIEIEQGQR